MTRTISRQLRAVEVDGLTLVMDLHTSSFYMFDEDASRMWDELVLAQGSVVAAKDALRTGQDSSRHLVDAFDDFVATCESRGFLLSGQPNEDAGVARTHHSRPTRLRRFLTTRAWLSMLRTDIALRQKGFPAVYERFEQEKPVALHGADIGDVERARAAFLRAENFYLRRAAPNDCLPRSLALLALMRRGGIPVVHRIGARRFPSFHCHAWVEYDGTPVLEPPSQVGDYTVIASI